MFFESGQIIEDASVVAYDGRIIAGLTMTAKRQPLDGSTWITGVGREYRGRGIGTAIKVEALSRAKARGLRALVTTNDEPNMCDARDQRKARVPAASGAGPTREAALALTPNRQDARFSLASVGAQPDAPDPIGALLLLGATISLLAAMYVVCYTFFFATWEGWESWNRRTGLDTEAAEAERERRLRRK